VTAIRSIVVAEIRHRWVTSIAMAGVVAVAVATVLLFLRIADLAADRTRIIQRDIGLNLRILPAEADLEAYWMKGYADGVIEEGLLQTVHEQDVANRLVPMLQRTVPWGEGEAILTGIGQELFARGEVLKPVFGGFEDQDDELTLGAIAAEKRGLVEGDRVSLLGHEFGIKRVLSRTGSVDDIRVYGSLVAVQRLLGMPGQLNEIRALECECGEEVEDPEAWVRSVLEPLLPGTQIIRQDRLADARRRQRILAERVATVAAPALVLLAALAVSGLAFINGRQRRAEIGLFVAVGMSAARIGAIITWRAAVLGIVGGIGGVWIGWGLVVMIGERLVGSGAGMAAGAGVHGSEILLGGLVGGVIAACGAWVPAIIAARTDPATTLRGE